MFREVRGVSLLSSMAFFEKFILSCLLSIVVDKSLEMFELSVTCTGERSDIFE